MTTIQIGTVLSVGNGTARVIAQPKQVWVKVRAAKATMPTWLETNSDRASEAGTVLSFQSVL